ncbi:phage tail assembly protein [Paraburkholderia sp. J12]|uniref:phage tail assembly protein n=1 Tax=Paraburkholderia sp. J12 TaxID=2805432 RepID=UPI002ABD501E|nr:phage tail assembly protein [Paraburkholderia sp. J12]
MARTEAKPDDKKQSPEDFVQYGEGYADITLSRPLKIGDTFVSAVRMREPELRDNLAFDKARGTDAEKEVTVFCNLLEMSPEQIHRLPLRDYRRVSAAYMGFLD